MFFFFFVFVQCEDGAAVDGGRRLQDHLLCHQRQSGSVLGVWLGPNSDRRRHPPPGAALQPGLTGQAGVKRGPSLSEHMLSLQRKQSGFLPGGGVGLRFQAVLFLVICLRALCHHPSDSHFTLLTRLNGSPVCLCVCEIDFCCWRASQGNSCTDHQSVCNDSLASVM